MCLVPTCRVLITATDIEDFSANCKLVFFNNFEDDEELGKGLYLCATLLDMICMYKCACDRPVCVESCQSN